MIRAILMLAALFLLLPASVRAEEDAKKIVLKEHKAPAEAANCKNCHFKKSRAFIKPRQDPRLEHNYFNTLHGKGAIACGSCHDGNRQNQLNAPASFTNPSPVCKTCHEEIFKDWSEGIHGKRVGGWNREKTQFHCIDCHSPHSVSFKPMQAEPAPHHPKLLREKNEGGKE
jgi:nitrate/TMAO reductase-like tetraheme cytochrome c subunit